MAEDQATASWDWKAQPIEEGGGGPLAVALATIGVHIQFLPSTEGSDEYGVVVSHRALTTAEVREADRRHLGITKKEYKEMFDEST